MKSLRTFACARVMCGRRALSASVAPSVVPGKFNLSGVKSDGKSRRIYNEIDVRPIAVGEGHSFAIGMDDRLLQTPRNRIMLVPTHSLALCIAGEWALQRRSIRPTSMPLTKLATSAIDQFSDSSERQKIIASAKRYLRSDSVCFRSEKPQALVEKQNQHWDPLLNWVKEEFDAPMNANSDFIVGQPEQSVERLHEVVVSKDVWTLAALDSVASIARSYIVGIAFAHGRLNAEQAFQCARVDEEFQIENWGCVEGSHDIDQEFAQVTLKAAETFLSLLKSK